MPSRTQIVCLCEGTKGESIDPVFINRLMKSLNLTWIRPADRGSNLVRMVPCGSRTKVVEMMPTELKNCLHAGGHTTLMVWADCDDDCADGDALKDIFWREAQQKQIKKSEFDAVVFIFAKDRLENWIQFLQTGNTDESQEGPRMKDTRPAADAAKKLADMCKSQRTAPDMPRSLKWSCHNWRRLVDRMEKS